MAVKIVAGALCFKRIKSTALFWKANFIAPPPPPCIIFANIRYSSKTETYTADRHLVGGQGSRLVGADDGSTAESFNRRKTANDSVLLRHSPGAECQTCCNDGWQAFWNGSHGQCHGNLEIVDCTLPITQGLCSNIFTETCRKSNIYGQQESRYIYISRVE